jgi:hypothetical protein
MWIIQEPKKVAYCTLHRPAYENGTDRGFRNVGYQYSDAGKTPKRKHNTYKTWWKLTIKKNHLFWPNNFLLFWISTVNRILFFKTTHHCAPPCTTVHHCAPLCSTVHHCAPPCTTVHHCAPLCTTVLHCAPLCSAVHHCAPLCSTVHHCAPLYSTAHHCAPLCTHTLTHKSCYGPSTYNQTEA